MASVGDGCAVGWIEHPINVKVINNIIEIVTIRKTLYLFNLLIE